MTSESTEEFENEEKKMLSQFRKCVPALTSALHKGQCGRIGVVGGSYEYSGAPYYVAMTSLRLGADLAHVFCTKDIATPIRSYSPDVIVHSTLDGEADLTTCWLPRLHALVVGPGLGREPEIFDTTREIVKQAKLLNKLIVFDAVSQFLSLDLHKSSELYANDRRSIFLHVCLNILKSIPGSILLMIPYDPTIF